MDILSLYKSTVNMGYLESHFRGELGDNRREASYALVHKDFGTIYLNSMSTMPSASMLDIIIYMGVATDKGKTSHRVAISLKNDKFQELTETELVNLIKSRNPADVDKTKDDMILKLLNDSSYQPIEGSTIIRKNSTDRKFSIIPNRIPVDTEIKIRCTCSDYFFCWSWYNADHKCLIGTRPPAYKKATNSKRTSKNPHKLPGMCKHTLLLIAILMQGGLLENMTDISAYSKVAKNNKDIRVMSRKEISNLFSTLSKDLAKELKERGQIRKGFKS